VIREGWAVRLRWRSLLGKGRLEELKMRPPVSRRIAQSKGGISVSDMSTKARDAPYLLINSIALSKHSISTNKTSNKSVQLPLLALVDLLLEEEQCLVDGHELGEVQRMRLRRVEYVLCASVPPGLHSAGVHVAHEV
jgi:hypothetical protein